ncbi:MAG: family 10 glycosylhydrolase [Chloroflexi bacterium]|nr:family 10 glycosylhydrolase [Chloroflexota bacterium]
MRNRIVVTLATVALVLGALPGVALGVEPAPGQFRAYWVDAFGEGLYDRTEVEKLVAATKAANMNAIVAQVGRRGDCFCNRAVMPRTQAAIAPLPYDPLDTLIEVAHREGIEVHAWIITTALWNSSTPPTDPAHAFNLHGPSTTGADNWLGVRYDGSLRESASPSANWFFDPGHPAAADYIVRMYTSVAENYDIDGLNFDRVRYPDLPLAAWPLDNAWGYNPVALARFQALTGRTDKPLPDDPQWSEWRRDQITGIVRRVYLDTYAIKPMVRISADTITYGDGPDQTGGWEASRPYREVLQDWRAWMEEGILDLNIPMNYKREFCTGGPIPGCFGGFSQRDWYEHWNEFAKDHQYHRATAIGSAIYLNSISDSVIQVRKALAPSAAGNPSAGWVGYSYRTPDSLTNTGARSGDASRAELTRALTQASEYDPITPPVFAEPAVVPEMTWKTHPTTGHVRGTVVDRRDVPFDQLRVELTDVSGHSVIDTQLTDGSGWFGFVDLAPGRYRIKLDGTQLHGHRVAVFEVHAGELTTLAIRPKGR